MKLKQPCCMALTAIGMLTLAVTKITGAVRRRSTILSSTSKPLIAGMRTSSTMHDGRLLSNASRNSAPSEKQAHSSWTLLKSHSREVRIPWSRSEEHTSELQSLMRISYAVFCLKQENYTIHTETHIQPTRLYLYTTL